MSMRCLTKACPRCLGDLFLEKDGWGESWQCLQCSFTHNVPDPVLLEAASVDEMQKQMADMLIVSANHNISDALRSTAAKFNLDSSVVADYEDAWQLITATPSPIVVLDACEAKNHALMMAAWNRLRWPQRFVVVIMPWWDEDEHLFLKAAHAIVHKPLRSTEVQSILNRAVSHFQQAGLNTRKQLATHIAFPVA